jgi:NAD(P)-dependent dehydrogenase (short-subunit alcohol dehydrogenase family)
MASYALRGKVALVTGAARGIGFETARLLHARGASVALADLDRQATEEAANAIGSDRTLALGADVTDQKAVERAVAATVERFGALDVPVANAGIAPEPVTVRGSEVASFQRVIDVNQTGVVNTVRACLPQVIERRGHIVVVASVYAFLNGVLATPYAMSKAAVEQLGRALRVELRPYGASATVAYFGFVDTKMVQDSYEKPIGEKMMEVVPEFVRRRITPRDAGEAIVRGIERRAPRVIAPRWWTAYSRMRGLLNPIFDARMERDERITSIVREADRPARARR